MIDVPTDYYRRLHTSEQTHWWYQGMQEIAVALLGRRLSQPGLGLLDAGCGTGGFLAWIDRQSDIGRLCGIDLSSEAIGLAREVAPRADLAIGHLHALPYDDETFDVVTLTDVLQHVDEKEEAETLRELLRVLCPGGALLVRTNSGLRPRRERPDWRLYSASLLRSRLAAAGFRVERLTHANLLFSAVAWLRGRTPRAPSEARHGIPPPVGEVPTLLGSASLRVERAYVARGGNVPWGHTLFAVAASP
jgi:2-polyprenyl-3-methyl-5-hydroxy-6-metoxy-1,4-benzoquinol methylase